MYVTLLITLLQSQLVTKMNGTKTLILSLLIIFLIIINLLKILLKPIWRLLLGSRVPVIVRTPQDRFEGLAKLGYDFKENYLRSLMIPELMKL